MTDRHQTAPVTTTRLVHLDHVLPGTEKAGHRLGRDEVDGVAGHTRSMKQCVDVTENVIQPSFTAVMSYDALHLTVEPHYSLNVRLHITNYRVQQGC